jgi:hypothetical protein
MAQQGGAGSRPQSGVTAGGGGDDGPASPGGDIVTPLVSRPRMSIVDVLRQLTSTSLAASAAAADQMMKNDGEQIPEPLSPRSERKQRLLHMMRAAPEHFASQHGINFA